jgi:excisionase family DNA binding protein
MPRQIPSDALTIAAMVLGKHRPELSTAAALLAALDHPAADRPALLPESRTKADVVRAGKVSLQTVNRWIATGKLRAVKVGRSVRIPRAAVEALLTPAVPGVEVV